MFTKQRWLRFTIVIFAVLIAFSSSVSLGSTNTVHAAGSPPAKSKVVDKIHGPYPGLNPHGVSRHLTKQGVTTLSNVTVQNDVIFIHGIGAQPSGGGTVTCTGSGGLWTNPLAYLSKSHKGLGSDTITWGGSRFVVGYYNNDVRCGSDAVGATGFQLSERNHDWAPACDNYPFPVANSVLGTNSESIEHIACEFSWYIYDDFSQFYNTNVMIVAHSMGGLITRFMIEQVQLGNSHFAPYLYISDVVTFSTPHAALTTVQADGEYFACGGCYEADEMTSGSDSGLMNDIYNHDHPAAAGGTDWTMIGSLSSNDPLDWDYQATFMSNIPSYLDNHRIGYSHVPDDSSTTCPGQPGYKYGYGHGDYVNDQCDSFDASYYYCDGCSRNAHSNFSFTSAAPHSLHEMLFALTYFDW